MNMGTNETKYELNCNEFFNRSIKSWLQYSDIEIYSNIIKKNLLLLEDLLGP